MKQILIFLVMVYAACSIGMVGNNAADERSGRAYTFVYILTGPATDIEPDERSKAFAGHFSNMKRMTEDGDLLMAGPYGEPKSYAGNRGLWIFNTEKVEKALEHAATDPPGKLGIFVFDAYQLWTDDALFELPRLKKEDEARRLADPDDPDEWSGRGYFIATGMVDKVEEPQRVDGVLMLATLVGSPETRFEDDHWMVLLDATSLKQAREIIMDAGCDADDWVFDGWYGSSMPAKLPTLRE